MDSIIDLAAARAALNRSDIDYQAPEAEVYRILKLPKVEQPPPGSPEMQALIDKWTRRLCHPTARKTRPLLWPQAWAFEQFAAQASSPSPVGFAGNLGVGSGKSLIALLAGHQELFNAKRTLILTKASLIDELQRERRIWGQEYALPNLQVMSYGALSSKKGEARMELIRPEVIVCDEGHLLKGLDSARTGRFIRYFNKHPESRLVIITGTFMATSLTEMAHLFYIALREGSPMPHPESQELRTWTSCIDEASEPFYKDFYDMAPLVRWSGRDPDARRDVEENKDVCRRAFFDRLATTPGFAYTTTPSCSAALRITADYGVNTEGPIDEALAQLRDEYRLPNGEDVIDSFAMYRAARQLSLGFYMRWAWEKTPEGEEDAAWTAARKHWAGTCRAYLKATSHPELDTPGLIQDALLADRPVHPDLARAWDIWAPHRLKPEPPTEVVWVDMAPLIHVVKWLRDHQARGSTALLWWESTAAIRPVLEQLGIKTYGAGDSVNQLRKETIAAPSQKVFGTGFNGQRFTHHFVLEPPSSPSTLEQLLGRSHRTGREDPVEVRVAQWAWPQQVAWSRAVRRSQVLQATMGQQQRVLHAELTGFRQTTEQGLENIFAE